MSTLHQLQEAGLDMELEAAVAQFMDGAEADDKKKDVGKKELMDSIDKNGLKNPGVMKLIGTLQRDKVLKPGLYKELVELNKKLSNGEGETKPAEAAAAPATAKTETPATEGAEAKSAEEGGDASELLLTEKQLARFKERMKKEEEKARKRLLDKEKKIREKLAGKAEKRAARLGMKVEEAAEIVQARTRISEKREQVKVLRADIKKDRELIKSLRPKRPKMTDEEKAARKAEREAAKAATAKPE